ncbi:unnamed protein product [Ilex paraguariensis]|uniref:Alcohol dehydrogenase N-terminal domain-containing protein n=1 Tax=Ilex paraguariensis TaxID=185542 RepID=A0ABC8S716_9AQUA
MTPKGNYHLGPHDVKVQMKAMGICGSDVHHFKFGQLGFNHATATSGPHDVKVQMKAMGICGSDVHHFKSSIFIILLSN